MELISSFALSMTKRSQSSLQHNPSSWGLMSKNVAHNHFADTVSIFARQDRCVQMNEELCKWIDQT